MKLRICDYVDNNCPVVQVLYSDGSITYDPDIAILQNILTNFKNIDKETGKSDNKWNIEYPEIGMVPGHTYCYITDTNQLVINDFTVFLDILKGPDVEINNLINVREFAAKHGKSIEQTKNNCKKGRFPGAKKIGRDWVIPADTPWPLDRRTKELRKLEGR